MFRFVLGIFMAFVDVSRDADAAADAYERDTRWKDIRWKERVQEKKF